MKIIGIEGMTVQQVQDAVSRGGRFVIYQYCFSIIVMTFRRGSDIHFVPPGKSAAAKGAARPAARKAAVKKPEAEAAETAAKTRAR